MSHTYIFNLSFFFFNDSPTTEIYTLSLHDALPIFLIAERNGFHPFHRRHVGDERPIDREQDAVDAHLHHAAQQDRKSTRLNSSHVEISYAVFCLKKKKTTINKSSKNTTNHHPGDLA